MKNKLHIIAAFAAAISSIGSLAPVNAQTHRGKASFYSKRATGAKSSSGERIHHDSLTCAHLTYPFGTMLKVTNLSNGKSCIVRVNDRGPHRRNRIIDLSYGAACELGMLTQGIAMVEVERVENIKIPFRTEPKEIGLPDFEFDISDLGGNFIKPFEPESIIPQPKENGLKKKTTAHKQSTAKASPNKKETQKK